MKSRVYIHSACDDNTHLVFQMQIKKEQGEYTFLVIESPSSLYKADFVPPGVKEDYPNLNEDASAASVLRAGLVRLMPLNLKKLKAKSPELEYKVWSITEEQYERLKQDIALDQSKSLQYKSGNTIGFFEPSLHIHTCKSWAEQKLTNIGLQSEQIWLDYWAATIPHRSEGPCTTL